MPTAGEREKWPTVEETKACVDLVRSIAQTGEIPPSLVEQCRTLFPGCQVKDELRDALQNLVNNVVIEAGMLKQAKTLLRAMNLGTDTTEDRLRAIALMNDILSQEVLPLESPQ